MFGIVEHEQHAFEAQMGDQDRKEILGLDRQAQCGDDRADQKPRIAEGRQLDKAHGAAKLLQKIVRDGQRHRGLAHAARTDDRDEPLGDHFAANLANRFVAADHPHRARRQRIGGIERSFGRRRRVGRDPRGRRDEAIAPAGHGRQIAGARLAGVERLAQGRDVDAEADLLDEDAGPDLGQQFLVADDFTGIFGQDGKDVEGARAQFDDRIAFLEHAFRREQPERSESEDVLGVFLKRRGGRRVLHDRRISRSCGPGAGDDPKSRESLMIGVFRSPAEPFCQKPVV
ncbi:MAG: hypothetical protein WDN08_14235 [Rhizomicrobium sp.]